MDALYDLKKMLCEELEKYGKKGDINPQELERIDKVAHAAKNIGKLIEMYEEEEDEYSGRSYPRGGRSYRGERYMDGSYEGRSYARDQRRDGRGRYSRNMSYEDGKADFYEKMEDLMRDAPDDHTRQEIQRLMSRMS